METQVVVSSQDEWKRRAQEFREADRLVKVDGDRMVLQDPDLELRNIRHPRQIQGCRFTSWSFWTTHHLSEKQIDRLMLELPARCDPTSPFDDG